MWDGWGFGVPLSQWAVYIEGRFGTQSAITSKQCTQPHGECGRVVRWPSALGWWCRRCRACHSSYNWDGMPGLAGPFHLHPAVRREIQKMQELIMSPLSFCLTVWGWNHHPPPPPRHLHHHQDRYMQPLHTPLPPTSFNSSASLIPLFIYPSHSLSQLCYSLILPFLPVPVLLHTFAKLLEYTITNHYKAFDSG